MIVHRITCPYCGTKQSHSDYEDTNQGYVLATCRSEAGGCRKPFVIKQSSITLSHATASPLAAYSVLYHDSRPEKIAHNTLQFGVQLARIAMLAAQRGDQFDYRFGSILNEFNGSYWAGGWKPDFKVTYRFDDLAMDSPDEAISEVLLKLNELLERPEETFADVPIAGEEKEVQP